MDLDSFVHAQYWCPQYERVTDCPGPCLNGQNHVQLPWCRVCNGLGKVNAKIVKHRVDPFQNPHMVRAFLAGARVGYQLVGDPCPTCLGAGAVAPVFN